jgi:hypothetical protein
MAESNKLRIDRWLAPVIIVFGAIGSLIGSWSANYALVKIQTLPPTPVEGAA